MTTKCDRNVPYRGSIDDATPEEWDKNRKGYWTKQGGLEPIKPTKFDPVKQPEHYNTGAIECIDAIKASMEPTQFKGYLKGNVEKYVWRYEYKNKPVEDLRKARWYLDRLIEENL